MNTAQKIVAVFNSLRTDARGYLSTADRNYIVSMALKAGTHEYDRTDSCDPAMTITFPDGSR